jgi:hypothetical protein
MASPARGPDRLYQLLPAVYRERDAAEGLPLRALLRLVAEQADLVADDVEGLWNDLFIETCRPWVIPYLGDLVGNRLLTDAARAQANATARRLFADLAGPDLLPPLAVRARADVAKTIYYRRRKATLPMLEELARNATGWPVHAVEFFTLLGWTQHREHFRAESSWTDVRQVERMDRVAGPFDPASHTVDVRRIAQDEGWHNLHNLGFFFYRLGSYPLRRVPARQADRPWRYHASPLGQPAPLFVRARGEVGADGLAAELDLPAPIRPPLFFDDLVRYRNLPPVRPDSTDLYGPATDRSLLVVRNGAVVAPAADPAAPVALYRPQIVCRRLDPWPAAQPVGRVVAVDVASGRLAIGDGWGDATDRLDVDYCYGFPGDLGGGPYERRKWLVGPGVEAQRLFVEEGAAATADTFPSLTAALTAWEGTLGRPDAVITLRDSRSYALPALLELRNEGFLVIEAANGERPVLATAAAGLEVKVQPPAIAGDTRRQAALTLSGVAVEGHLHVTGDLFRLRLLHATLVPGRRLRGDGSPDVAAPSLVVEAGTSAAPLNAQLRVEAAFSIAGALQLPEHAAGVWLLDSILDALAPGALALAAAGGEPGPDLHAERATIAGGLAVRTLELSESIVTGTVETVRTQEGCVRFSYLPPGSRTPRRYRCQPDLAAETALAAALANDPNLLPAARAELRLAVESRVVPAFSTLRYGRPAYAQLRAGGPVEIGGGAEDGSEMGAFCHLKQPQRESNLRLRLVEYLPFGLEAGILFAT